MAAGVPRCARKEKRQRYISRSSNSINCTTILLFVIVASLYAAVQQVNGIGGVFVCPSGMKIPQDWVCDGGNDCYDEDPGSDEQNCGTMTTCTSIQFTCANGGCVSSVDRCNGDFDCSDNSDERGCPQRPCQASEFSCNNRRCIHGTYYCDDDDDCGDNSDELNCPEEEEDPTLYECPGQYGNGTGMLISQAWRCDRIADCPHGYDEIDGCDRVNDCDRFGIFNCSNGQCISANLVCDGTEDCTDDSDENCPRRDCDPITEFECHATNSDGVECLPIEWKCDGEVDCRDELGSDEISCLGSCSDNEYSCFTGGDCVAISVQCDGVEDCRDGSDEYLCDNTRTPTLCPKGTFPCHNGHHCVGEAQLCDGQSHCSDGSDEHLMWCNHTAGVNACTTDLHGCQHFCHETDHAYYCSCHHGYYLDDTRTQCIDINECEDRGVCSQLCCNSPGSYHCYCGDGFELRPDGSCKPIDEHGQLLLLDKVDIRLLQTNGRSPNKVIRDLVQAFAIDYHLRLNRIFWSELTINRGAVIKSAPLAKTIPFDSITVVIDTELESPHGLAIDWITNKIYWTDEVRAHVTVAELDGSKRHVLFSDDMRKPRGIALDPTNGYMYWTDWGDHPRIEKASMDGTMRRVLHSDNIAWPNALTIDYQTLTLYWVDAKFDFIESSSHEGCRRQILYREKNVHFHPFGLTYYRDHLYLADFDARVVNSFLVKSRNQSQLVNLYTNIVEPMAVVAVAESRQPRVRMECEKSVLGNCSSCDYCSNTTVVPVNNPCEVNNGGCEYMCLLSVADGNRTHSCACPTGHRLAPDGQTCLGLDNFILMADKSKMFFISLDAPHPVDVEIPLAGTEIVSAVTWDSRDDTMYYADLGRHTINSASINGQNQRVILRPDSVGAPVGLALDWLHDRLYWADSEWDLIESCDLDGQRRAIIVYEGLDRPRDVVLDPERGLMFWSDWSEKKPRIMKANLDGSSASWLARENIDTPNGVALDYENKIVYWVDGVHDTIEMVNYDGSNRATVVDMVTDHHPSGLDFHNGLLYWTSWTYKNLQVVNVSAATVSSSVMIRGVEQSRDVNVFHRRRNHTAYTPCRRNNGGCSHICVTKAKRNGGVKAGCLCKIGYPLLSDGKTCASEINASLIFPTSKAIHIISQDVDTYIADTVIPVDKPASTITTVAMDPINDVIYYATTVTNGIHKINLTDQNEVTILDDHKTAITSIAVDHASQNIYFVDSYEKRVEVASTDGRRRKVLHDCLINPVGLAIDPISLTLFYVDSGDPENNNKPPKIYSAAMDGSSPDVFVSQNLGKPLYIAVDNGGVNGRIFWTDSERNTIRESSLDGQTTKNVIVFGDEDVGVTVTGVTYFDGQIYFTDRGNRKIYNSSLHFLERDVFLSGYDYLSDIKAVERNKGHIRGCSNSSRCDYLCLPNPNVPSKQTCSCATGVMPLSNGSCPKLPDTFLLLAGRGSLRQIALDDPSGNYIDVPLYDATEGYTINAVDYLLTAPGEGFIYFSETRSPSGVGGDLDHRSRIRRRKLYQTNHTFSEVLREEIGVVEGIAVDWTTGNVYFTVSSMNSRVQSHVAVMDSEGEFKVTLATEAVHKPRGIALHPTSNLMYWTDFGSDPKVMESKMDGSYPNRLISRQNSGFSNLKWPNDVAIDYNTNFLYVCDGGRGTITVATLSGNGGTVVVSKANNPGLRRSMPAQSFIFQPQSLVLRPLDPSHRDNDDPNTKETEMYWADPEISVISASNLVSTGTVTSGVEKHHLRLILSKETTYMPYTVRLVTTDGHKPREITGLSTMPCSTKPCHSGICININTTNYKCLSPSDNNTLIIDTGGTHASPTTSPESPQNESTPNNDETVATGPETTPTGPGDDDDDGSEPSESPPTRPGSTTLDPSSDATRTNQGEGTSKRQMQNGDNSGKTIGVSLGVIAIVVSGSFVAFFVAAFYFWRRTNQRDNMVNRSRGRLRERETPAVQFRSVSSLLPATADEMKPKKEMLATAPNNKKKGFRLPTKQCNNIIRGKSASSSSLAATTLNKNQPRFEESQNLNEFSEPEFYVLDPVPKRRSRRMKTPPESPLLKKEEEVGVGLVKATFEQEKALKEAKRNRHRGKKDVVVAMAAEDEEIDSPPAWMEMKPRADDDDEASVRSPRSVLTVSVVMETDNEDLGRAMDKESSAAAAVTTTAKKEEEEEEEKKEDLGSVLPPKGAKPSRSCLSSTSSEPPRGAGLSVHFSASTDDFQPVAAAPPPPPLPPKSVPGAGQESLTPPPPPAIPPKLPPKSGFMVAQNVKDAEEKEEVKKVEKEEEKEEKKEETKEEKEFETRPSSGSFSSTSSSSPSTDSASSVTTGGSHSSSSVTMGTSSSDETQPFLKPPAKKT